MATILVIDDESNIRRFAAANLAARGYDVVEAGDAESGLEMVRQHLPDAVLLDVKLPGMDGWGFLDAVSADASLRDIPVVVITGSIMLNDARQARYPAIVDILVKPLSVQQLMLVVQKAVVMAA